jgi:hypothetical protein
MSESKNLPLPPCTNPCPAKFDQISAIQHGRIIRAVSTVFAHREAKDRRLILKPAQRA